VSPTGLEERERKKGYSRLLLNVLGQLDDYELAILVAFAGKGFSRLENLRPQAAVIGADPKVQEDNEVWDAAWAKLERLRLLYFQSEG
jgi:hypothetical protein